MVRSQTLSVVIPVFNEDQSIKALLSRLKSVATAENGYEWEFIFVDDGSTDETASLLSSAHKDDPRAKLISFTRNFGHQAALTAGIMKARGDAVITMDGDGQHPPEALPLFLRQWENGSPIVQGVRRMTDRTLAKKLSSEAFYWLINKAGNISIRPNAADFRLMARGPVDTFKSLPEQGRFIRGMISWMGYSTAEVPYDEDSRLQGDIKFTPRKMFRFAIDAVTSFSAAPLHAATILGFTITFFAAVYTFYALGVFFFARETTVPGWTSIIVVQLFLGGVQLTCLGIIGEYLFRLHGEVKRRPLYVVRDTKGL